MGHTKEVIWVVSHSVVCGRVAVKHWELLGGLYPMFLHLCSIQQDSGAQHCQILPELELLLATRLLTQSLHS